MGNGASVDSIVDVEEALAKAGNGPLDENAFKAIFGPQLSKINLFDLIKDPDTGHVHADELKHIVQTRRQHTEKRKAKVLAAAGSAAVEDLMKTTAKKDEELKALERQQAEFQASLMAMSNSGRLPSEEVQAANAKKMAQFQAQTETLKREQSSAKSQVMAVRKEELAKAAAQRQAMMGKIRAQMDGKTPFPGFRPGGGGGGGGGGDFSPSKTFAETMREKELKDLEKSKTLAANTSRKNR